MILARTISSIEIRKLLSNKVSGVWRLWGLPFLSKKSRSVSHIFKLYSIFQDGSFWCTLLLTSAQTVSQELQRPTTKHMVIFTIFTMFAMLERGSHKKRDLHDLLTVERRDAPGAPDAVLGVPRRQPSQSAPLTALPVGRASCLSFQERCRPQTAERFLTETAHLCIPYIILT